MSEENLNKEPVNEGEQEEILDVNGLPPYPIDDTCQCDFDVDYCCVSNVPSFFDISPGQPSSPRIFYDPTCLSCRVEECTIYIPCSNSYRYGQYRPATVYAAVITGCMPFHTEARFNDPAPCSDLGASPPAPAYDGPPRGGYRPQPPTPTPQPDPIDAAICCGGIVCFDNAVAFGCREDMEDLCRCINMLLSEEESACNLIDVEQNEPQIQLCNGPLYSADYVPTNGRCTPRTITFSGTFTIDSQYLATECGANQSSGW